MILGLSRWVIERMIASIRVHVLLVDVVDLVFDLPSPGACRRSWTAAPSCAPCASAAGSRPDRSPHLLGGELGGGFGRLLRKSPLREVSMSPVPRIRLAVRSGWKTSKSASASPLEANMMGLPVTRAMDSAAPPQGIAVDLVSTTRIRRLGQRRSRCSPRPGRSASTTKRISSGWTASRMSAACWSLSVNAAVGRVDDDHVVQPALGLGDRAPGHLDGPRSDYQGHSSTRRCPARGRTRGCRRARRSPGAG